MYSKLQDLVRAFLPRSLLDNPSPPAPNRGGWQGLFLASPASFFTGNPLENDLIQLVQRWVFWFLDVTILSVAAVAALIS